MFSKPQYGIIICRINYSKIPEHQLVKIAKLRGIDIKGKNKQEIAQSIARFDNQEPKQL